MMTTAPHPAAFYISLTFIPEPSSAVLTGATALLILRRRRRGA